MACFYWFCELFSYRKNMAGLWLSSSNSSSSLRNESNFDRLVKSLTPRVLVKPIPESRIKDLNTIWNPIGGPITEYFTMCDLWRSYKKWSAYGTKTAVILSSGQDVDQCFYPSLSALQLFTNKSPETMSLTEERPFEDSFADYMSSSPTSDCTANLYFEFNERVSPYNRHPLYNTVKELAKKKPGLMTLTSIDLSPASWMAVAWYPICHIPNTGLTIKDFQAAFLTFHTLSSFYQDAREEVNGISGLQNYNKSGTRSICLHPFGFAALKLMGDIWLNHGDSDYKRLYDLNSAADSWIKQLSYYHHDYLFFTKQDEHFRNPESSSCYYGAYTGSFQQ